MEYRHLLSKVGGKNLQQLGGKHNLRHQDQSRPAPAQRRLNKADVHLGLSAARHAVEQGGTGGVLTGQRVQPLKGRLLLFVEHRRRHRSHLLQRGPAQHLLLLQGEDAALFQRFDGGHRRPGKITQILNRSGAQGAQQLGHCVAQGGSLTPGGYHGHGVLRRNSQYRQLLCFIPHRPLGARL